MNILLVSQTNFEVKEHGIYMDLIEELASRKHHIYVVYPLEKRQNKESYIHQYNEVTYVGVKTGNLTKNSNLVEKGISMLRVDAQYIKGIKTFLRDVEFDLVLYSTPPISLVKTIKWIKRNNTNCRSYLMLKDIFPQNAVDLEMMSKGGILHRYFSLKEKKLYEISDGIGVMSKANKEYLEKHHPEVIGKVNLFENALKPTELEITLDRSYFNLPQDKTVFIYGGNLGKPQAIDYVVKCLKACSEIENAYFAIAGSGGEKDILTHYIEQDHPTHVKYFGQLKQNDYQQLSALSDVGLIFLDHRFTIPNYPQRVLTYLELGMPVICATDKNSDIGTMAVDNNYGYWCESVEVETFKNFVHQLSKDTQKREQMGRNAKEFFLNTFTVDKVVDRFFKEFVK